MATEQKDRRQGQAAADFLLACFLEAARDCSETFKIEGKHIRRAMLKALNLKDKK